MSPIVIFLVVAGLVSYIIYYSIFGMKRSERFFLFTIIKAYLIMNKVSNIEKCLQY